MKTLSLRNSTLTIIKATGTGHQSKISSLIIGNGHTIVTSHHHGILLEQLHDCKHKWPQIAEGLRFKGTEIDAIRSDPIKMIEGQAACLSAVLSQWTHWAAGDARGSRDRATLEALKRAVDVAGFPLIANALTLSEP